MNPLTSKTVAQPSSSGEGFFFEYPKLVDEAVARYRPESVNGQCGHPRNSN
jgi:hypothetical protein